MQAAFDLDAALFSAGELAEVSGLGRSMVDVWVSRGLLQPTRRERPKQKTKGKARKPQGRPLFSVGAIFQVRLTRELGAQIGIGSSEWVPLANIAAVAEIASGGNWMWPCARGAERAQPFNVYAYAARSGGKWLFDMHVGEDGAAPCFGLHMPHIFIPMSEIFASVYVESKKILGVTGQAAAKDEDQ
jgi:hypothetical protein